MANGDAFYFKENRPVRRPVKVVKRPSSQTEIVVFQVDPHWETTWKAVHSHTMQHGPHVICTP